MAWNELRTREGGGATVIETDALLLIIIICGNQPTPTTTRRWRGRRAGPCGIIFAALTLVTTTVLRSATRPGGVELLLLVLVLDVLDVLRARTMTTRR